MRRTLLALLAFGLAASLAAQSLQMGTNVGSPNTSDINIATIRTDIDLVHPADATGLVDTARFSWSNTSCPAAVKIKFFRRQGSTVSFVAERGPFDSTATVNTVSLTPPVEVEQGDLVGIARVADCGNAEAITGFVNPGYLAYAGDITSDVGFAAGQNGGAVLDLEATGTAIESIYAVLPVAGSTPGAFGSFFRTGLQIANPNFGPTSGRLVFHPANVAGSSTDPSVNFSIDARSTISYADVVESMGQTGLGTIDVVLPNGAGIPLTIARVFDDAGTSGTKGFTEEAVPLTGDKQVLFPGATGFLVGPADVTRFRYNIGIRALLAGAFLTFRVRDQNGVVLRSVDLSYDPTFFTQQPADTLLGGALPPNASIEVSCSSGGAVVYGATVDNTTNDPSIEFVKVFFAIALGTFGGRPQDARPAPSVLSAARQPPPPPTPPRPRGSPDHGRRSARRGPVPPRRRSASRRARRGGPRPGSRPIAPHGRRS